MSNQKRCGFVDIFDTSKWTTFDEGVSFNTQRTILSLCGNDDQTICITITEAGKISFSHRVNNESISLYYSVNGVKSKVDCSREETCVRVEAGDAFCFIKHQHHCENKRYPRFCGKSCDDCAYIFDICFKGQRPCPTGCSSLIPFSSGPLLDGPSVTSQIPRIMGFGSSSTIAVDGSGEAIIPPQIGGFAFPVPFAGTIQNLEVGVEVFVTTVSNINLFGLQYDFTVLRAPSVPNNGIDHAAAPYASTSLVTSVKFGQVFSGTLIVAGTFRTSTNINLGSLVVAPGDRVAIRVKTTSQSDVSVVDVTQLSFHASLGYNRP